ncbi:cytochrome P450 monooxygenase [Arthroderma uncinatum]|uniref:cytochrome P450 monooxygenase n=1 Tax=Arthroderma uncinatum TaxID=74035 RepID=UPI00144AA897|nr:cytochrome P450 monooxygenase [Arthroderma uncinatum]KAF3482589.1 cytochrome P450 monooxygenase [Arthroderma uncinatum]
MLDVLIRTGSAYRVDLAISFVVLLVVSYLARTISQRQKYSKFPLHSNKSISNTKLLLAEGFSKYKNAFHMNTALGKDIILSAGYVNDIKSDPHLDFAKAIFSTLLTHLSTFHHIEEAGKNEVLKETIKSKLSRLPIHLKLALSEEATAVIREKFTDNEEWHELSIKETIVKIVARVSSRVFLGEELCRNEEWLRITADYTVNLFVAINELQTWPASLRPIVQWFLPTCQLIRNQVADARRLIQPVIDQRHAENNERLRQGKPVKEYDDAISWLDAKAGGRDFDAAIAQLSLSFVSIHTTTDLCTQAIYDICANPELVQPLREEAISVLGNRGWDTTSLYQMKLLDSVIKESQRLKPAGLLAMKRYATQDITLSDGLVVPRGASLSVSTHGHWEESVYPEPNKFDGYRFLKMKGDHEKDRMANLVATSPDHLGFGHGIHACPGRFFAADELKILLTHILLKYDIKVPEGTDTTPFTMPGGAFMSTSARVAIRRRKEEITL